MLPKPSRLTRVQLNAVIKSGVVCSTPVFNAKILKSTEASPRYAVAVSTKIAKLAVVRNRLRRIIYEFLPRVGNGLDIVIFPRSQVINLTHDQIGTEIDSLLSKISGLS